MFEKRSSQYGTSEIYDVHLWGTWIT